MSSGKYEVFSIHSDAGTNVSPYEKMASPEPEVPRRPGNFRRARLEVPVISIGVIVSHLQSAVMFGHWVCRNGTSHVPYKNIASPERDEPRSL